MKLQYNTRNKQHFLTVPKIIIEATGWKPGDDIKYRFKEGNIILEKEK